MSRTNARHARIRATRTVALALLAVAALIALSGCAAQPAAPAAPEAPAVAPAFPVTITDDAGKSVTIDAEPQRIVSLAPANTEIAFALGLGDRIVGVTTYDDYPAEVKDIAKVGDFTTPNFEAIAAADPDLVLATTGVQADAIKKLESLGATVIAIDPQNLAGVYADIERVGKATGTSEKAATLVADMKDEVAAVQDAVSSATPVTAFVEIAQNPLFTAGKGTLIDELVTLAGGKSVVTQDGYVAYSSEQVIKADPDVYLATKGSMSNPAELAKRAGFSKLSAVKADRVFVLDDNLVSRPGPRVVEGLKQIASFLHPDTAPTGQ
ncbi:MAG: ABC transporter substrate-binding protein [Coriobacteriia bacterium]|nr:ABC transporter substrate-binding protein [Coriobacteriia bacterium]